MASILPRKAAAWRVPSYGIQRLGRRSLAVKHHHPASLLQQTPPSSNYPKQSLIGWGHDRRRANTAPTTSTTRLLSSTSSSDNNNDWSMGDTVQIPNKKGAVPQLLEGCIEEVRGSGWYTVRVTDTQDLRKVRTSQLISVNGDNNNGGGGGDAVVPSEETIPAPRPTVSTTEASTSSTAPATTTTNTIDVSLLPVEEAVQALPAMTVAVESPARYPIDTNAPPPPPPRMDDLDALLREVLAQGTNSTTTSHANDDEYLQQLAHHASIDQWVVFTDLHCAPSTLETTLEVLQFVHNSASSRPNTGVLFLGDFWHHRGTLRVDCLNAVLNELATWTVPMIMIPGNHDQVTLGGQSHSLTPLERSYRVATTPTAATATSASSVPGPLVFSHPTLFAGALFVPHIRDIAVLESVLQSDLAQGSAIDTNAADAIFVHADVTGAYMNDLIVSTGGVHPSVFPAHKPIYSGHFHKPHTVTYQGGGSRGGGGSSTGSSDPQQRPQVVIEYFGSPYETTLAEAQQAKALVVLDARQKWKCVERIPISIGRKHYKPHSLADVLALALPQQQQQQQDGGGTTTAVQQGDRIVATLSRKEMKAIEDQGIQPHDDGDTNIGDHIHQLRKGGVTVELREANSLNDTISALASEDARALEDLTPVSTWKQFWEEQVNRGVMDQDEASVLQEAGLGVLDELEDSSDGAPKDLLLATPTNLELDSVTVEGYGPFLKPAHYPLNDRGLVLLRGSNRDGGSDSNGSGKTSLAMAALWALTGSADPRPFQDNKVSDVVNDSVKNARVAITGSLNGLPFAITRTKGAKKGGLAFILDGEDLTTQSVKETMALIDEKLGVSAPILARTMFHGQHALNDLLEATDAKFKDELSLVTPLELWQAAAKLTRTKTRDAGKLESELQGKISLRTDDMVNLKNRRGRAATDLATMEYSLAAKEKEIEMASQTSYNKEGSQLEGGKEVHERLRIDLAQAKTTASALQAKLSVIDKERDSQMKELNLNLAKAMGGARKAVEEHQRVQLKVLSTTLGVDTLRNQLQTLEATWQVDLSSGEIPDGFKVPDTCPTCLQPVTVESPNEDGHEHNPRSLQAKADGEISAILGNLENAQLALSTTTEDLELADRTRKCNDQAVLDAQAETQSQTTYWDENARVFRDELRETQRKMDRLSDSYSASVELQQKAQLAASILETQLKAEREAVRYAKEAYVEVVKEAKLMEESLGTLNADIIQSRVISKQMSGLTDAFGNRGVQTFVLQNAVKDLESLTQNYLDDFSDGAQRLQLALDAGDRILRRALVREVDGTFRERSLATLSGGQWRRSSLALTLGFADLVSQRGKLRSSLMVLDEPLTFLDRAGRSDVGKVLRKILDKSRGTERNSDGRDPADPQARSVSKHSSVSTIVMILQDLAAEELEEAFDHIDEVVKKGGSSSVKVDEESD